MADSDDEVSFTDLKDLYVASQKSGWQKLDYARQQAHTDGYDYIWIDTCCIDKSSSTELGEAINSMFRWYQKAEWCYVYLSRMPDLELQHDWESFKVSSWFTRGWTLQEMLAPEKLRFYSRSWATVGELVKTRGEDTRRCEELATKIKEATNIHEDALLGRGELNSYSVAQRMSWAANRITTREEDRAYSLLGIFDINIPVIYGEGPRAFGRLQEEIIRTSSDQSIFLWGYDGRRTVTMNQMTESRVDPKNVMLLATGLKDFEHCADVIPLVDKSGLLGTLEITSRSVRMRLPVLKNPQQPTGAHMGEPIYTQAILASLENDPVVVLAITFILQQHRGSDVAGRMIGVQVLDRYQASFRCVTEVLHVNRLGDSCPLLRRPRYDGYVMIRCKRKPLDKNLRVKHRILTMAEPQDLWDQEGKCLFSLHTLRDSIVVDSTRDPSVIVRLNRGPTGNQEPGFEFTMQPVDDSLTISVPSEDPHHRYRRERTVFRSGRMMVAEMQRTALLHEDILLLEIQVTHIAEKIGEDVMAFLRSLLDDAMSALVVTMRASLDIAILASKALTPLVTLPFIFPVFVSRHVLLSTTLVICATFLVLLGCLIFFAIRPQDHDA